MRVDRQKDTDARSVCRRSLETVFIVLDQDSSMDCVLCSRTSKVFVACLIEVNAGPGQPFHSGLVRVVEIHILNL